VTRDKLAQGANPHIAKIQDGAGHWSKTNMRKLYTSLQLSVMNYAAPSWQRWLSKTNLEKLERVLQNKALRHYRPA